MGYTTRVTGEFVITPPLAWAEFKDSPHAPHNMKTAWEPSLILRVAEDSVDTADGPLLRRTATGLVMRDISEYREDGLVEEVQSAIDAFPGHVFTERLECEGEENTDIWRVEVRDGKAVRIEPSIVWPGEIPEVDASEVMSPAEEAELIKAVETSTDADFVEVTRPEQVVTDYDPRDLARRFMQSEAATAYRDGIRELFAEEWADLPRKARDARVFEVWEATHRATVTLSWPDAP